MNATRIAELRNLVTSGAIAFRPPTPAEIGELLDAVERKPPASRQTKTFTAWLMELEQISGCGYSAKDIAWFKANGFAKGLTPMAAFRTGEES